MSKRAPAKKKEEKPTNGSPAKPTDERVAQQKRILEVVGANADVAERDASEYSPRTEVYIHQLQDVLDFFGYSSGDIAALVKRCNHDEQQIQLAVDNILEDRANHEQSSWGVVRTKKQQKEDKKAKDEEEKQEQERIAKELEKQQKEAKKKAAKEEAARKAAGHKDEDFGATLPPDPAILFAGPNPAKRDAQSQGQGEWWKENEDWNWKGSWNDKSWEDSHARGGQDEWWSNDWDRAGGEATYSGGGRGRKGGKGQRGDAKDSQDAAEMWDMPTGPDANHEGGLDQWALGDIRKHERKIADLGVGETKAPPPSTIVRTVEEIERGFATSGDAGQSAGKMRVEALFQEAAGLPPPAAPGSSPPQDASFERPERGRGRGAGGKGKGRGEKGDKGDRNDRRERDGEERPDRGERNEERKSRSATGEDGEKLEKVDRSEDPRRQPVEEAGENVSVKKHSSMGCAVITLRDTRVRDAIVAEGEKFTISNIKVQIKPHKDKDTKKEVPTDIFAAWGRQVEKMTPLSERDIVKFFEEKHRGYADAWRAEREAKEKEQRDSEERARQKLLDEQRVQERRVEDERRRLEEDLLMRRQQEQRTRLQQEAQQAAQVKWMADIQNSWMQQQQRQTQTAGVAQQGARPATDPRTAQQAAGAVPTVPSAAPQQTGQQMSAQHQAAALNPSAAAYPTAAAAQQWQQQWMQAIAMQGYGAATAAQGWNQSALAQAQAAQAAQRGMQQAQMQGAAMGQMAHPQAQDYEAQMRAYYAQITQFGQATAQHGQYQPNAAAYGYNAAAAAQYGGATRGEHL